MNKRHVIFDLDGTLVDPSLSICNSINYALKKKGYNPVRDAELYPYIGKHLIDPFKAITGVDNEDYLWELIHLYRERYETIGVRENRLYPGIKEVLAGLDAQSYIASIKPWHASRLILKELEIEKYFTGVYGSEEDGTRADKAQLLRYIKDVEGLGSAVMVGDRDTDIYAAKSCGFASIAVCYGYGTLGELEAAGPDIMIDRPEDLSRALKVYKK